MIKINIAENLDNIRERISNAAIKSGRKYEDITLIGVTKYVDILNINKALELGIKDIGESKVQEVQNKFSEINKDINWHMIGHLQTNKVKYIIDKIDLIHSLDRISLAEELHKRAEQSGLYIDALLQVNISGEDSKFGLTPKDVFNFIEEIYKYDRVRINGLMTMAPYCDNPEETRYVFKGLKDLQNEILAKGYEHIKMNYLSMGMTNDFKIAIEEGSNMVRIGTGIFDERNY